MYQKIKKMIKKAVSDSYSTDFGPNTGKIAPKTSKSASFGPKQTLFDEFAVYNEEIRKMRQQPPRISTPENKYGIIEKFRISASDYTKTLAGHVYYCAIRKEWRLHTMSNADIGFELHKYGKSKNSAFVWFMAEFMQKVEEHRKLQWQGSSHTGFATMSY